jgi:hypothetical protein
LTALALAGDILDYAAKYSGTERTLCRIEAKK